MNFKMAKRKLKKLREGLEKDSVAYTKASNSMRSLIKEQRNGKRFNSKRFDITIKSLKESVYDDTKELEKDLKDFDIPDAPIEKASGESRNYKYGDHDVAMAELKKLRTKFSGMRKSSTNKHGLDIFEGLIQLAIGAFEKLQKNKPFDEDYRIRFRHNTIMDLKSYNELAIRSLGRAFDLHLKQNPEDETTVRGY